MSKPDKIPSAEKLQNMRDGENKLFQRVSAGLVWLGFGILVSIFFISAQMWQDYGEIFIAAGIFVLGAGMMMQRYKELLKKKVECTNCMRRFTPEEFTETEGTCPHCKNTLFNHYVVTNLREHIIMAFVFTLSPPQPFCREYEGKDLLNRLR